MAGCSPGFLVVGLGLGFQDGRQWRRLGLNGGRCGGCWVVGGDGVLLGRWVLVVSGGGA